MTEPRPTEPSSRKRFTDAATVGGYRMGALAAKLMPGPIAQAAATSLGFGASFSSPAKRAMIERHLQRVNPKLRGASLRVADHEEDDRGDARAGAGDEDERVQVDWSHPGVCPDRVDHRRWLCRGGG